METRPTMTTSPAVGGAFTSRTRIATAQGSRYLQQLCKHFAHKIPAEATPTAGAWVHGTKARPGPAKRAASAATSASKRGLDQVSPTARTKAAPCAVASSRRSLVG